MIKGFFLTIKKSYESFVREVESFIDENINGIKPRIKKLKQKSQTDIFNMNSISLNSDPTQINRILSNPIVASQINKTLKKISNSF